MSHPLNPDNLPMRPPTPFESAYDLLAVRWWFWTDPCPRGPRGLVEPYRAKDAGRLLFAEAARRLREYGLGLAAPGVASVPDVLPAHAFELAMALACGDES